jgi:2-methylisocitrate lyase-like PEP mutase family enzyme
MNQQEKGAAFRALHAGPTFVIPNPWDVGSARLLESLGFKALATTSSGFAFTLGRQDGGATLNDVATHVTRLAEATDLPISVDMENGYGAQPERAAAAVRRIAAAGAVGGSIEDWDRAGGFIYELPLAVERVTAAVEAARALHFPFTFTARAENHVHGHDDLDDTIARLQAFERAGADVLFAPGLATLDAVRRVCQAVSKPVNVLARRTFTVAQLAEAGARRLSVGGGLTWIAADALVHAATAIRDTGDFSVLQSSNPTAGW